MAKQLFKRSEIKQEATKTLEQLNEEAKHVMKLMKARYGEKDYSLIDTTPPEEQPPLILYRP